MPKREYVRVTEKDTGHKVSILAAQFNEDAHRLLKQDAVDVHGDPLPPEFAAKSPSNQSGQKANTTKETS